MTGSRLDRNSVFFRFASEGNVVEKIDFHGKEIAVGDLKQAIAEKKSLPKFDLVLVNEATNEVYKRDGAMLPRNMSITVRRTPLQNSKKAAVVHLENKDIWSNMLAEAPAKKEVPSLPVVKRACPPEYLCPLCRDMFDNPSIARCCGRSACEKCFGARAGDCCPLCAKPWDDETKPIHNPRLAETVASLDLEYFILPGDPPEPAQGAGTDAFGAGAAPGGLLAGQLLPPGAAIAGGAPGPWGPHLPVPGRPCIWPPPPAGVAVRPCMLSPGQFHAWQQSLKYVDAGGGSSSSSSSDRAKLRRRKSKDAKKKHKKKRAASESREGRKSHKKHKRG